MKTLSNPFEMTKIKVVPFCNKEETADDRLPYSMYSEYFEAIVSDDVNYVNAFLSKADVAERQRLVNTEFDFEGDVKCPWFKREIERGEIPIVLPLHIAVTNSSLDVATVLVQHGAEVLKIDSRQNNLLHACVMASFYSPTDEESIVETLDDLTQNWSDTVKHELLLQENKDKYRPLEFAGQQSTLNVMKCLFLFGDKWRVRTEHNGMMTYTWNDVTEYEAPARHGKSPLVLFTYMERAKALETLAHVLACPLFGEWIRAKVRLNAIPMAIWCLMRAVFVLTYFVLDRNDFFTKQHMDDMRDMGYNVTDTCYTHMVTISEGRTHILCAFLFFYSLISMLFDITDTIKTMASREYKKMMNLNGFKNMLVKLIFYRICTLIVSVSIFLNAILFMALDKSKMMNENVVIFMSTTRILVPVCAAWSLMYFLQMLPFLGKSIVAIQGMLVDMANFLILWCLMLIPFVHTFNVYVNSYSKQGCIKDFDGLTNTLYTVFRMMLNMVDLTQYDVYLKYFLYILHMVFVFKVAIILINFLIAIMSESAQRTAEHHLIIEWLNSLSIAVTIQERFGSWLLRPYYNFMLPKIFTQDHNGRLCIVTRSNRKSDLKELYKIKRMATEKITDKPAYMNKVNWK